MSKMFVHYSGTVASFKEAKKDGKSFEEFYNSHVVFIKGGTDGNGAAIYTHGEYFGDVKDALAALQTKLNELKYFSKISDGINIAEVSVNNGGTISIEGEDPAVTTKIDPTGIKIGLSAAFKKAVNEDLPAAAAAAKKAGEDAAAAVDAKLGAKNASAASGDEATAFGRIKNLEEIVAGLTGTGEGDEVQSVGAQITNAINALDVEAASGDYVASISQEDGKIVPVMGNFNFDEAGAAASALDEAKGYAESLIAKDSDFEKRVAANESAIATLNGEATVEGSVKKQVADAIAGVVANAPEDFDTLKEVADWIGSDTTGAAQMQTDIATLKADANTEGSVAKTVKDAKEEITNIITENERVVAEALTDLDTRTAELEGKNATIDSALQAADIVSGSANGTISVKGADIAVKGLGSAAYTEASAYATAAQGALAEAAAPQATTYNKTEVDAMWEWEEI